MIKLIVIQFLMLMFFLVPFAEAQSKVKKLVSKIETINSIPETCDSVYISTCGDSIFWEIVSYKLEAMPFLIKKLDDTTSINIRIDIPNYIGNYKVADIAFIIMQEIVYDIPFEDMLGIKQWMTTNYWRVLSVGGLEARKDFQRKMKKWFKANQSKFEFIEIPISERHKFLHGYNPNGGFYKITE